MTTYLVVVKNKRTNKMYEFQYKPPFGEIEVVSSGVLNWDDLIVTKASTDMIDWENGYVLEKELGVD